MVTHLPRTLWSSLRHYPLLHRSSDVGPVSPELFDEILDDYDADAAFLHVGLSDVKAAFETNPYEFVVERLRERFPSLLVPGFTKSFRDTGRFDVEADPPELNAFSRLFYENDAEYRTPDPLHSILCAGEYRFDGCDFRDTFGPDGCYAQLEADDVLCLNVGTHWLVSTQLHYLEQALDVPYVETVEFEGEIVQEDGTVEQVTQTNYDKNLYIYFWNRTKLRDQMVRAGVLDWYRLNGLDVMAFKMDDLRSFVEPNVLNDPYYLVA